MLKKICVALIAFLMLLPVGGIGIFKANSIGEKEREAKVNEIEESIIKLPEIKWSDWDYSQIGLHIHTDYNGIEKDTPILQSIFEGIDVDNNPSTGQNGNDIKVFVMVFPYAEKVNGNWVFLISFIVNVIRLGEEIKNGEFEISLGGSVFFNVQHKFRIGYYSPNNEEIPREVRESITIVPYIFYEKDPEFYIYVEPIFDEGNQNLSVILEYSNLGSHKLMIDYYPAVKTMVKVSPNVGINKFNIAIERFASIEQTIRMRYEGNMAINLTMEDIPQAMNFSLNFSENYFEYEASDEFNTTLMIEVFGLDYFMLIKYLPRHLKAQFEEEGYLYIYVNQRKTKFIISNDLENPTTYFSITNLTGEAIIQWGIGKEGHFKIDGLKGMKMETKLQIGSIYLKTYSIVNAEHLDINWNLSIPGNVFVDTNMEWLSFYSFNFSIDDAFGILIEANSLKAEDFMTEWETEFPFFNKSGEIQFIGNITFAIMLNGTWYYIF